MRRISEIVIVVKKRHTVKSIVISNRSKEILYISESYVGSAHDFSILKSEFPCSEDWFAEYDVELDLGFKGFENQYKWRSLKMPHKKPKNKELCQNQILENYEIASERIIVEHAIGGIKRYRILSDRLRTKDMEFYNKVLGVCAGLWNFLIKI